MWPMSWVKMYIFTLNYVFETFVKNCEKCFYTFFNKLIILLILLESVRWVDLCSLLIG